MAAAPTKSDAEERVVEDPTHEADKGRRSPPASRRSRRAVAAKTYFEDDDDYDYDIVESANTITYNVNSLSWKKQTGIELSRS